MSLQTPVIPNIKKITSPNWPEYIFEWHPDTKKVYLIRKADMKEVDGQIQVIPSIIAEHANDHGQAFGFVQTFLRGVSEGRKTGNQLVLPKG